MLPAWSTTVWVPDVYKRQVEKIDRGILAAIAVYIGKTRLIDNFMYELEN